MNMIMSRHHGKRPRPHGRGTTPHRHGTSPQSQRVVRHTTAQTVPTTPKPITPKGFEVLDITPEKNKNGLFSGIEFDKDNHAIDRNAAGRRLALNIRAYLTTLPKDTGFVITGHAPNWVYIQVTRALEKLKRKIIYRDKADILFTPYAFEDE